MKINSRYLYIFSALCIFAIVISSAGAADDLISDQFENESFVMDVPSGSDFSKEATTNLNVGDVAMNMSVFANNGDNSNDVSAIMYMKDSSSNQNIVSDLVNDLERDGNVIEENDKFTVIETQNSNTWDFLNIGDDLDTLWSFVGGLFSSDSDVSVSTADADVQVSSADGINVVDNENTTVTLSGNGLHVSDASGEDVSISTDGVKVSNVSSGDNGDENVSVDTNVTIDPDTAFNIEDGKYAICIKDLDNGQVIVIVGDNLDVMKEIAQSTSFNDD